MASGLSKHVDDILREIDDAVVRMKRSFKDQQARSAKEIREQNRQIREAEERLLRDKDTKKKTKPAGTRPYNGGNTNQSKGQYGEAQTIARMRELGYKPINSQHGSVNSNGIDHIFRNDRGHIVIVESKYGKSRLGHTLSGRQMSLSWLFGRPGSNSGFSAQSSRVHQALSHDRNLAFEVLAGLQMDSVSRMVSKIDAAGNVSFRMLD